MERGTNSTEYVTETISMNFDFIQLKERADFILPALIKELKKNEIFEKNGDICRYCTFFIFFTFNDYLALRIDDHIFS